MTPEEEIKKEVNEMAPGFPFSKSTPPSDGYFDHLPDTILNRWRNEQSKKSTHNFSWQKIAGIAAVTAVLIIGVWRLVSIEKQVPSDNITSAEAYQYIYDNINDFEYLIETNGFNLTEPQIDIPAEDIQEYLIEQLDDENPEDLF